MCSKDRTMRWVAGPPQLQRASSYEVDLFLKTVLGTDLHTLQKHAHWHGENNSPVNLARMTYKTRKCTLQRIPDRCHFRPKGTDFPDIITTLFLNVAVLSQGRVPPVRKDVKYNLPNIGIWSSGTNFEMDCIRKHRLFHI